MTTYLIKRILLMFVTMFGICLVSFVVINLAPGDPADQSMAPGAGGAENQGIADAIIRKNRERLFLDKPILINTSPGDRSTVAASLIEDLLSDDSFTVLDVLEKKRLARLGTIALPALIAALDREDLDEYRLKNLLKALKKVAGPWELPEDDPKLVGDLEKRKAAWKAFWKEESARFSEAAAAKAARRYLSTPKKRQAEELAKLKRQVGHAAIPALMEVYRDGGKRRPVAAQAMAAIVPTPWDLTMDANEVRKIRSTWTTAAEQIVQELDKNTGRMGLTGSLARRRDRALKALVGAVAAQSSGAEGAEAKAGALLEPLDELIAQARRRGRRGAALLRSAQITRRRLDRLGSAADFLQAATDKELKSHRRSWRNWWDRHEEKFVTFGWFRTFVRVFTDTRFGHWLGKLIVLDFGESYSDDQPVIDKIKRHFPVSFKMNFFSIMLTYLIAIPIGIYSSTHQYSLGDRISTVLLFILYSLPTFWVGTMMILLLTGPPYLDWFPSAHERSMNYESLTGWEQARDTFWHLTLPTICLTYSGVAYISRQMRAGMLETIRQDFIRTARAKGLSEPVVVFKHALRNSLIPIITLLANLLPIMIGGSVIIETIFSIDGLGKLSFEALLNRDYPLIMAIFTFSGFLTLLGILLSDMAYAFVDPRIRYQ